MMGSSTRAVLTAVATAVLAVAAVSRLPYLIVAVLVVAILLFASGWPRLLELPRLSGPGLVITAAGLASLVIVVWWDIAGLVVVVGLSVLAAFLAEMLRGDPRPRVVQAVTGSVTGAVIVISATGWVDIGQDEPALAVVLIAAGALAVGAACTALPLPGQVVASLATLSGGALGGALGAVFDDVGVLVGILTGLTAGILTSAVHLLFGRFPTSTRRLPALAAAMLPLLLAGTPTYLLGALVIG